jgi:hypothetical protein
MTARKPVPSLSDLTAKDKKEDAPEVVETEVVEPETDEVPEGDEVPYGTDPVLENDETYAEPAVPQGGSVVDNTNFDMRGNGVTDNMPVDWDANSPSGAVTSQTPTENASTSHTVVSTVYAEPSIFDDKGLGKNVPEVEVSEAPAGARESILQTYADQNGETESNNEENKKEDK